MSTEQLLEYLTGRLQGLSGTARYELPDALREELREIAELIQAVKQ